MKKRISILLIITLILMTSVPVFAESKDSSGLEQAILAVKKVVTIPNDYKEFEYFMNDSNGEGVKGTYWNLSWKKPDSSDSISTLVSKDGYILRYNKYSEGVNRDGIGKVTRDMAKKTAVDFLAKARPDMASKMKLQNSSESNTRSHYFSYKLYESNVPVDFMQAYFEVDKFTGEISSYNGLDLDLPSLVSKDNIISKETAKKALLDSQGLELKYYSNYDYNKKTLTIFPAFGIDNQNKVIDAKTGKLVEIYNDYRYYGLKSKETADKSENAGQAELTKEEIAAIQNVSTLISKEKAEALCRTIVPGLTSSMKVTNTHLYKNYIDATQYIWEIGFDGAYVSLDAKTGALISFYLNQNDDTKKYNGVSKETAKNTAETFIKRVAEEKFTQTRLIKDSATYQPKPYVTDNQISDYSFHYERMVNSVPFHDNSISITIDNSNGKIIQYNCQWYDSAKFPAVDKSMTSGKAFDLLDKDCAFDLKYVRIDIDKVSLVYGFQENVNYLIDPINGTKIGWDGKPYKENKIPEYIDIKGHWCEKTVNSLLENGYYIEGDQFHPNSKMTQLEFLRFLYAPEQVYYSDEDFYKMLETTKIILPSEKAPKKELTRQDAAKFAVRYLGQAKSAEHPEIFINPFKDSIAKEYRGYIAICYGVGIMKGDKNGRFNGNATVNHAEAATIIYQALKNK